MTTMTTEQPEDRWQTIRNIWKQNQWLYVIAGFLLGMLFFPFVQLVITDAPALLGNLVPEAISTLAAVFVIDRIYRWHADKERLQELITQMRSSDIGLALAAVEILRLKGWLTDGSLKGATLWGANLQGARLDRANLTGANLFGANLQEVRLFGANLEETSLVGTNLVRARLVNADLTRAYLDDANLARADLYGAIFGKHTSLPDESWWTPDTDMTRFTDPTHPQFWRSDDPRSPAYRGMSDRAQDEHQHDDDG